MFWLATMLVKPRAAGVRVNGQQHRLDSKLDEIFSVGRITRFAIVCMTLAVSSQAVAQQATTFAPVAAEHHAHIRSKLTAETIAVLDAAYADDSPASVVGATTADQVLAALDRASTGRALLISIAYRLGEPHADVEDERARVRAENDYVAGQVDIAPDRLVAACSINPLKFYALDEVRRCSMDSRIGAIKLHFTNSGVDLRNRDHVKRLAELFRLFGELALPAVVHLRTGRDDYGATDARIFVHDVLSAAPDLHVQIAHMAGWGGYDDNTDSALGYFADAFENGALDRERISFDLAAVVFDADAAGDNLALANQVREANRKLAERIRSIGVDRILFATDWPSWPPTQVPGLKISQNIQLLHKALPLTDREWAVIHSNISPVFE